MKAHNDQTAANERPLPYGTTDVDPQIRLEPGTPRRVRCFVRGCQHVLRVPTRPGRGEICPVHGIRCHCSASTGPTYTYPDVRRNVIVSHTKFAGQIVGHPFKYESHRLGSENSEDALTWNVFRSLQKAGCLNEVARWITGQEAAEPYLFLWGICLSEGSFRPWDLLIQARDRYEGNLPVVRPLTQPDIALYLPGRYLILIEAKFTSPNPFYAEGPRRDAQSLTKSELLDIYQDPGQEILDIEKARTEGLVFYQLWRNTVFADWMARAAGKGTKAYHANLTRAGKETDSCARFRKLVRPQYADRFTHIAWEDLCHLCTADRPGLSRLHRYLETKTTGLRRLPPGRVRVTALTSARPSMLAQHGRGNIHPGATGPLGQASEHRPPGQCR